MSTTYELNNLLKAGAHRGQRSLHVLERDFYLFASIGAHIAGLVDAKLASEIDRAAGSGYLHHMAVAKPG
jgi:hypothetical protein